LDFGVGEKRGEEVTMPMAGEKKLLYPYVLAVDQISCQQAALSGRRIPTLYLGAWAYCSNYGFILWSVRMSD
jgi:hypothetical protein